MEVKPFSTTHAALSTVLHHRSCSPIMQASCRYDQHTAGRTVVLWDAIGQEGDAAAGLTSMPSRKKAMAQAIGTVIQPT
jgi:hypothetical protein